MKSTMLGWLAAGLLAAPLMAGATEFKFDYVFGDGTDVSGTFDGTAAGEFVTGVSDVSLNINGAAAGPTGVIGFWGVIGLPGAPYTMSFDPTQVDFWFLDSSAFGSSGNVAGNGKVGFALIGSAVTTPLAQRYGKDLAFVLDQGTGVNPSQATTAMNDSWSLTAVPEPGSLGLLGLGLAAAVLLRRRKAS
jgi:PEP-CTERM motif